MASKSLFSRVRTEIFRLLFGVQAKGLHIREIERQTHLNVATVRHELQVLSQLGLVVSRRDGNRLYYMANQSHPIYPEIHGIVLKTIGLVDILSASLSDSDIQIAFVFGSFAREEVQADSDIDLMVIGDLGLRKLVELLDGVTEQLGREINPHIMSQQKFRERFQKLEPFITRVMDAPKLFISGTEHELTTMVR